MEYILFIGMEWNGVAYVAGWVRQGGFLEGLAPCARQRAQYCGVRIPINHIYIAAPRRGRKIMRVRGRVQLQQQTISGVHGHGVVPAKVKVDEGLVHLV
jgi:hypothetical protein